MSEHLKVILGSSAGQHWLQGQGLPGHEGALGEVLSLLWQQCPQGRCPLAQTSIGCWHRVASDAPALGGPFSLYSISDNQIFSLFPVLKLLFHHPPLPRAWGLLPFPCPCHSSASSISSML